jgi:hypothetical protein
MVLQPESWVESKRTVCYEMKDANHILVNRRQCIGGTCGLHIQGRLLQIQKHGLKVYSLDTQGHRQAMDHQFSCVYTTNHKSEHHHQLCSIIHTHLCLNPLLTVMIQQYNVTLQHPVALHRTDFAFCFYAVYVQLRVLFTRHFSTLILHVSV